MIQKFLPLLTVICLSATALAGEQLPLKNPGFEEGLDGWILLEQDLPKPMTSVDSVSAHSGSAGLRVNDQDKQKGSSLVSQPLPAEPGRTYRVHFFARASADDKGAVYLRFYDANRKILNLENLPKAQLTASTDWKKYDFDAVSPDETVSLGIWIHTWTGATGVMEVDDFSVEVSDGKPSASATPPVSVTPVASSSVLSATKRDNPAMIVLKLDDLKPDSSGNPPEAWNRVLSLFKARKIKGGFGLICDSLQSNPSAFIQWLKDVQASGAVEIWFHGLNHDVHTENGQEFAEFSGRPYDEQKRRFEESIRLVREKTGIELQAFGPPGGGKGESFDAETVRVMADVPEMKVWLYPQPLDDIGRQLETGGRITILDRVWQANIEQPLFKPNAEKLVEGYQKNPARRYFVLQGHPAHWNEEGFAQFEKILDFLTAQGAVFVTPSECATVLTSTKTAKN